MKTYYLLILLIIGVGCQKKLTVNEIIDKSVAAAGGDKVYNSVIEFDFRNKHYVAKYHHAKYELKRIFSDSTGNYIDILNNDGFTRRRNDTLKTLTDEWSGKYANSVNSVIYFFRIPFILKDAAVKPQLIGSGTINDQQYYKIRIDFSEEGGGEDYSDSFVYWINKGTFYVDYLAYSYSTSGGGKRFRVTINPRNIDGLRVVDYINYEPKDLKVNIEDYDQYYKEGGLEELSRIINKNVTIKYLP